MRTGTNGFEERMRSAILVEKLLLKRNPLDYQAYIETFRESLIDANPHQIEAVMFALEKLENGGCILADEVGLGKTIEAGLVITQYRASRRFNILVIVPTSLAGQWNNELRERFQISSRIITSRDRRGLKPDELFTLFSEDGVYIVGRELASRLQKDRVLGQKQWDLIVVDEAHEVFANIYQRFSSRDGQYNEDSKSCATAGHLFRLLKRTPVLLLTATPLQNNILEIWGLSAYILPDTQKSHLGQYNHFRELFIDNGTIIDEKIPELQERLGNFLIRNLRLQAQTFMNYKFTQRNCETVNFNMGNEEKALYDAISAYFERDDIYAYSINGVVITGGDQMAGLRNLLKLSYRRVLGSSFSALKKSLYGIIDRLERMKTGVDVEADMQAAAATDDSENDEEDCRTAGLDPDVEPPARGRPVDLTADDIEKIDREIAEVQGFISGADCIQATSKDEVLIKCLEKIFAEPGRFYPKVVIFTTYIASQGHLKKILEDNGFKDEIILFSGTSRRDPADNATITEAVEIWGEEVGANLSEREKPVGTILERTALVHYFKTKKKIFISTEAGAKGLNLQFCNVLFNYDLPWNPQRIEQRIGRCHRYGQEKDVWVINCINADNETEKRIYEILMDKFHLFKSVLGAGDDILGTLSKSLQFEKQLHDMMNRFKTESERLDWLKEFEANIDEETRRLRDEKLARTRTLIDNLDPNVTLRLKNIRDRLPASFSQYDHDLLSLLGQYAQVKGFDFNRLDNGREQILLQLNGEKYYIGKRDEEKNQDFKHINLKDPLLEDIIRESRAPASGIEAGALLDYTGSDHASRVLEPYRDCQGRWDFYNVDFSGVEEEEHLFDVILVAVPGDGGPQVKCLNDEEVKAVKSLNLKADAGTGAAIPEAEAKEHLNLQVKEKYLVIQQTQQPRLDKKLHNLEIELQDMEEYLKNKEEEVKAALSEADHKINTTFDRETGKQLLKDKERLQNELKSIRKELLAFQDDFQDRFDKEERRLQEKRFIETSLRRVFTLHFQVR